MHSPTVGFALWILGLAAGAGSPTDGRFADCGPGGDSRTLKLEVSVDPTIVVATRSQERDLGAPHIATVRVTLTNPNAYPLRLNFPNPCFLGFRLETMDGKEMGGDGTVCIAMTAELTLAAGGKEAKTFRWDPRTWAGVYAPLEAGQYRIVGTLDKRYCGPDAKEEPPLRTAPVLVEVRPPK